MLNTFFIGLFVLITKLYYSVKKKKNIHKENKINMIYESLCTMYF